MTTRLPDTTQTSDAYVAVPEIESMVPAKPVGGATLAEFLCEGPEWSEEVARLINGRSKRPARDIDFSVAPSSP